MSTMTTTTYEAASDDRGLGAWSEIFRAVRSANDDYVIEGKTIAARAERLLLNDAHMAALMRAMTSHLIGTGIALIPQYQADDAPDSTEAERAMRRQISAALRRRAMGKALDAAGQLTQPAFFKQLIVTAFVHGDAFAVRQVVQGRTRWRIVHPCRISNPERTSDTATRFQGVELRAGQPIGIHVLCRPNDLPAIAQAGSSGSGDDRWQFIPWSDDTGCPNVVHYVPDQSRAGQVRGVSMFAPLILNARHLMRAQSAYVSGKAIQASHPIVIKTANPAAAQAAQASALSHAGAIGVDSPRIAFIDPKSEVVLTQIDYNGADHKDFIDACLRTLTAAWGLPWQYVVHQLTDANLASAQAALDQAEQTFADYHAEFCESVCRPIDLSLIHQAKLDGELPAELDADRAVAGDYSRPRRSDANRLRSSQAAQMRLDMGVSRTTVFAELDYDFENETRKRVEEDRFLQAQGVVVPGTAAGDAASGHDSIEKDEDQEDQEGQEEKSKPEAKP